MIKSSCWGGNKKGSMHSHRAFLNNGGEGGIRTLGTLPYTHFPGVLLRPLGHLSNQSNRLKAAPKSRAVLYTNDRRMATLFSGPGLKKIIQAKLRCGLGFTLRGTKVEIAYDSFIVRHTQALLNDGMISQLTCPPVSTYP
jgi:hypothetical protein